MSNTGYETFLRVGIDGTQAPAGERVVVRSLDAISGAATTTINKVEELKGKVGRVGDNADGSARVIKRSMNDIKESVEVAGVSVSTLENMFIRLAARTAMIAGIYGTLTALKNSVKESLDYLGKIESAQLGIASSFLVSGKYIDTVSGKALEGQRALKAAQQDSAQVIEQLKVANFQTIASLDELVEAYQVTLPVAMAKGFNKKQVLDYTQAMVQAAGAIRLPFNQMAEETRSLLTEGAINPRNSRIATVLGIRNEDIRKYKNDTQGLFDFLMGRLEGFRVAGIESQKTWMGLWSNIKDISKQGGGMVMEGMFEGIKSILTSIQNSVLTINNETKKIEWNPTFVAGAKELGSTVTTMFNGFVTGTKFVYEHTEALKTLIALYAVYTTSKLATLVADKIESKVAAIAESRALNAVKLEEVATTAKSAQITAAETQAKANLAVIDARVSAGLVISNALKVESLAATAAEAEANVAGLTIKQADLTLRKETTIATIAELEAKIAHEASVKRMLTTGPDVNKLEKDLLNNRRQLGGISSQLVRNETKLTSAKEASLIATNTLNTANTRQLGLEATHAELINVRTAATLTNNLAQEAATVATEAHSLALYKASLMGRAFTGVMTAASSVLSFFGGWVGLIVTALGVLATAWFMYGNEAEKANKKALSDADDVLKSLREQNSALEERNRLNGKSISGNGLQDPINGMSDKALASVKTWQQEISNIQEQISPVYGPSDDQLKRVEVLKKNISDIVFESQKARFRKIDEAAPEYKNNSSRVDTKDAEKLAQDRLKLENMYITYLRGLEDTQLDNVKKNLKLQLDAVNDAHSLKLISDKQALDSSLQLSKEGVVKELSLLETRKDYIIRKAKEVNLTEADLKGQIAEPDYNKVSKLELVDIEKKIKLATDYQTIVKKEQDLNISNISDYNKYLTNVALNTKALAQADTDHTVALKEQNGATLEAVNLRERYKQSELQKSIDSITSQVGPMDANTLKQISNMEAEIAISKGIQVKATYEREKVQGDLNVRLLEQAGLVGDAAALQEELRLANPGIAEADAFTQSLERMVAALNKVASALDQLQRNDSIKFEIEDQGVDQYTVRERNIRREYEKTKKLKTGYIEEYKADVFNKYSEIKTLNEDLALNDQQQAARTNQLKIDMTRMYVDTAASLMGNLAAAMDTTNRDQFEASKALQIGQAIMNTAGAVMQAMANLPPPASYIASGVAIATGALQVAKISSTSFGGGGNVSGGAPSGSFGSGGGGSVGSSRGKDFTSVQDQQSSDSMSKLSDSMDNASVSMRKVADGLTKFTDSLTGKMQDTKGQFTQLDKDTDFSGDYIKNVLTAGGNFLGIDAKSTVVALKNAMFGDGKWRTTGAGVQLGIENGGLEGQEYTTSTKKGGYFKKDKTSTAYTDLNDGFTWMLENVIKGVTSNTNLAATIMGTSANIGGVNIPQANIATAGRKSEDIQKDVETWLQNVGNEFAKTVKGLDEFANPGEEAYAALMRLATALQTANGQFDLLGISLYESTLKGADLADNLINLMGGTEKFTDKTTEYFTKMFSESEQATMTQAASQRKVAASINDMNSVYGNLNWTVPQTREEFRSLVNSLDLTTERGASLFAALMETVPAFDEVLTSLEKISDFGKTYQDWDIRGVQATGVAELADVYAMVVGQERELLDARKQGLDTTLLEKVQKQELNKYLKEGIATASDNYTSAQSDFNQTIIDGATTLLNSAKALSGEWKSIGEGLTKTRNSLMIGANSNLSPEAQLAKAKSDAMGLYTKGVGGDKEAMGAFGSSATSYLDLAKKYYASTTTYADEFSMFTNMLGTAEGYSQQQVNYAEANMKAQQDIIDQLQKSEEARTKEAQEAAKLQMATMKVLMEGFNKILIENGKAATSLAELEAIARREAVNG